MERESVSSEDHTERLKVTLSIMNAVSHRPLSLSLPNTAVSVRLTCVCVCVWRGGAIIVLTNATH